MTRVLLVDDDAAVRDVAAEVLELAGFEVTVAAGAEAAVARLRAGERFAVLVTDEAMPGLGGTALIAIAASLAPAMRCLLMTGYGELDGLPDDAAVLSKPFRPSQLEAAVRALLT